MTNLKRIIITTSIIIFFLERGEDEFFGAWTIRCTYLFWTRNLYEFFSTAINNLICSNLFHDAGERPILPRNDIMMIWCCAKLKFWKKNSRNRRFQRKHIFLNYFPKLLIMHPSHHNIVASCWPTIMSSFSNFFFFRNL